MPQILAPVLGPTEEQLGLIFQIIGIVIPIVLPFLSGFISQKGQKSNTVKMNLKVLLEDVLYPINTILENKDYKKLNNANFEKIKEIINKHYNIIPPDMHRRFIELSFHFANGHCLNQKVYNAFKKYVSYMLISVRKKLSYPSNNVWAFLITMSICAKCFYFIPITMLAIVYIGCLIMNSWKAFIVAGIILLYSFIFSVIETKIYEKKKKEWLKNNDIVINNKKEQNQNTKQYYYNRADFHNRGKRIIQRRGYYQNNRSDKK